MKIVEFQGERCIERPLEDWQRYICKHLKAIVTDPGDDKPSAVNRVLQNGNRTSDIFLIVNGRLPEVEERDGSPLVQTSDYITCGQCWINVYASSNL